MLAARMDKPAEHYQSLIRFVSDRPGHDRRYSLSSDKIERALGWRPAIEFERGLMSTIAWYLDNTAWVEQMLTAPA